VNRLGVWENATAFYTAQVISAPSSARAHSAVAFAVYQPANELDQAAYHYQRAVQIFPQYHEAWNNLGLIKKAQGNLAGAINDFETALKWHDKHVAARVNVGQAYQTLGENKKAIDAYLIALEGDSTHAIANNNLAILYAQHGKVDSARGLFERVLRHHPNYLSAQKNYQLFLDAVRKP
jgi:tetratricopeptide (TPR) repeat protein